MEEADQNEEEIMLTVPKQDLNKKFSLFFHFTVPNCWTDYTRT